MLPLPQNGGRRLYEGFTGEARGELRKRFDPTSCVRRPSGKARRPLCGAAKSARKTAVGQSPPASMRRRQVGALGARYACRLERRRQKHLVLILAREFASNLATPTLI